MRSDPGDRTDRTDRTDLSDPSDPSDHPLIERVKREEFEAARALADAWPDDPSAVGIPGNENVSPGLAVFDYDNDGDGDLDILNMRDRPTLLRNDTPRYNHWLQINLRGRGGNLFGVGVQVRLRARDLLLADEVHAGRGYQSHYGLRLHFGLGRREQIESVEVHWVGGETEVSEEVQADRRAVLAEGEGRPVVKPRSAGR